MKTRTGYFTSEFRAKKEDDKKFIEGYFIRYNEETELWPGVKEMVAPESVVGSLEKNDIRALYNHDTGLVLGRVGNSTLKLKSDSKGLYGVVEINENDKQAMDIYARVERQDINACSFGFNITNEEYTENEDGTVLFTLRDIDLHEVSIVNFPAYPTTSVQARKRDLETYKERKLSLKKEKLKERIRNA